MFRLKCGYPLDWSSVAVWIEEGKGTEPVNMDALYSSWMLENTRLRESRKEGRVRQCLAVLGEEFEGDDESAAVNHSTPKEST